MNKSLYKLSSKIGDVISRLHHKDLPESLLDFIQTEFSFDHALILAFQQETPPKPLYKSYHAGKAERSLPEYLQTTYMLDPVYNAHLKGMADGFYKLHDIAPDRFHNTAFYKNYYKKTGYTDEVLFFCKTVSDHTIAMSLFKENDKFPSFNKPSLARAKALSPIICGILRQHWNDYLTAQHTISPTSADPLSLQIKRAILKEEGVSLTDRQAEIIAFTLRGHSATSIGMHLEISPDTVKVHRRNIYSRLRISSQNQLFSIVIKATGHLLG